MPSPTRNHHEVKKVLESIGATETYMDGALALVRTPSGVVEITRGHSYYWCVKGLVPLSKALKLFADPVGKRDIRVHGHCGCPAPEGSYITWIAANGKKVIDIKQRDECRGYVEKSRLAVDNSEEPTYMGEVGAKILAEYEFSDNPALDFDAKGYVDSYHIDSDLALKIFVDEIKAS